jgi:uncharacterized protein YegL
VSPQALSSVLVVDVSGSMSGTNINLAKEAARAWEEALPIGITEYSTTTINNRVADWSQSNFARNTP